MSNVNKLLAIGIIHTSALEAAGMYFFIVSKLVLYSPNKSQWVHA
jgi:hypothetical protein